MDQNVSLPYQQLTRSKRQFRLLRLLDSDTNCLRCELSSFSLLDDDLPRWRALSYCWGDDEPQSIVNLNGYPIAVRKNLYIIISQMAAEKWRDWTFIDALCIDQDNDSEKPDQVVIMGEIYRRAEEVVSWIVHDTHQHEGEEEDPIEIHDMSRTQLEDTVLQNEYWSRLWIVQEVLLAKRLTIRIGSAEVEWSNLIPEKKPFDRKGLPTKNKGLFIRQVGTRTDPWANRTTALNILSYRRFETRSIRAGRHLPFHRAFDFFAMQRCGRLHDKVFGYLGLTNSRIQADYSTSILDLFVATFADYLMSAGLITEDLTPLRKRMQFLRTHQAITAANDLVIPLLAFGLELYDPIVNLLFREVAKFFAPGYEDSLYNPAMGAWWSIRHSKTLDLDFDAFLNNDHKFELKYIGSVCIKAIKFVASETIACTTMNKEITTRQKALAQQDAVLTDSKSGESKRYSEWAEHARGISHQMWRRFQESGEDAEGHLDEESWTLIA